MANLMKKYDPTWVMHGLTLQSAELLRRGGRQFGGFERDEPIEKTTVIVRRGEPLKIQVEISAAGGGTTKIRQTIGANDDLEILCRAALASMSDLERRNLISDLVRSELIDKQD